jgi:hypothetical protein
MATRVMGGGGKPDRTARLFARMVGARDVALGLGAVIALDRGKPVRGWIEAAALTDTADCVTCVVAREQLAPAAFGAAAGVGATFAILGVFLSRRLDPAPPAHPGQPEAIVTGHSAERVAGS